MHSVTFILLLSLYLFSPFSLKIHAAILPFPSTLPSVSVSYDSVLLKTWAGIKKRNIDAYSIPLVHRPKSEEPGDAVSEGVGYGMICALYCNDQTYFNKIWDAGEQYMWNGNAYNWRVDINGKVIGSGAASDAEQDIAFALICADLLVKKNIWQTHTSPKNASYAARAQSIINNIWGNLVEEGKYLRPGNLWGGKAFVNPGYFAPAFYRIFAEFESTPHNWPGLIDQCYKSIAASPGYKNGLVPDWMKPDGSYSDSTTLGYNAYENGKTCYKDAIRIFWRISTDYLWYSENRAKTFLDKSMAFVKTPARSNFYQMNGTLVPGSFALGNKVTRPRAEYSHMTLGMWAPVALSCGTKEMADSFSTALLSFYKPGSDFFGKTSDAGNEDTLHNEMYFDQFLAWFGASLISGIFTNLWEDLKDTNPSMTLDWKTQPTFSSNAIDANVKPLIINATFNKPARWAITFKQQNGDSSTQFTGIGDTINFSWYGFSQSGFAMPIDLYEISILATGLAKPIKTTCWLGRVVDLKENNRIIIDDFRDKDLIPFIGTKWQSYLDSYEGKAGKSTVPIFTVQGSDTSAYLRWSFLLSGSQALGYNPYAALEWNCELPNGNITLTGLDTLIFIGKSLSALPVSVQLVTSDITDFNFFEDSVSLTSQYKEYRLPIKGFKHRFSSGSGSPTLSKLTAIRFQIQKADGTTNEILLKKMLFSGSLSSLYQSPPPYVEQISPVRINQTQVAKSGKVTVLSKSNGGVLFLVPKHYNGGTISIFNFLGKEVCKLPISSSSTLWDSASKKGKNNIAGIYVAFITSQNGSNVRKFTFSKI